MKCLKKIDCDWIRSSTCSEGSVRWKQEAAIFAVPLWHDQTGGINVCVGSDGGWLRMAVVGWGVEMPFNREAVLKMSSEEVSWVICSSPDIRLVWRWTPRLCKLQSSPGGIWCGRVPLRFQEVFISQMDMKYVLKYAVCLFLRLG